MHPAVGVVADAQCYGREHPSTTGTEQRVMSASVTRMTMGQISARLRDAPVVVDAYRAVRDPRRELEIAKDLRATRQQLAAVRALPAPAADAKVALVALYRDDIFDAKVGAALATALRLQGLRPVVSVPNPRMRRALRYARAFGITDVVIQDRIAIDEATAGEIEAAATELLAGPVDFDSIKAWRFRGWSVGTHVLSTVIRLTFDGSPDLAMSDKRQVLEQVTRDVLTNYVRAEHVVEHHKLTAVLVEEANYSVNGPLVDVATAGGVDVIQTIPTWRDDALMSKRLTAANRRVDCKSVSAETLDRLMAQPWTSAENAELDADFDRRYGGAWQQGKQFQPGTEPRLAEAIVAELGIDTSRPTAVIFAHVLWDASLFFGVDLFENYGDWFLQSIGAAIENDSVNWIVKAHPSNVFRTTHGDIEGECSEILLMREHYPQLPGHVKLLRPETKISTLSLYRWADYGITVRGTPGMEMACFGKSVFTAGTGTYAGLGFTHDSSSVAEYLDRLRTIRDTPPPMPEETLRARRYAHTLFLRRPWVPRTFELVYDFLEHGWHPLDRNLVWRGATPARRGSMPDLDAWSSWVCSSRAEDYLSTAD
jgi:hypothetical protein